MHNALLKHLGINAVYVPLCPPADHIREAIAGFRVLGFSGANVTIPFKEAVGAYLDELSPVSQFTGSVNTLYWKDGLVGGTLVGTTTDPYGALQCLAEAHESIEGRHVTILGNGGAARAIAFLFHSLGARITIVCRNRDKGESLAQALHKASPQKSVPSAVLFEDFPCICNVDIVLNATSVGMTPKDDVSPLPKEFLRSEMIICDIVYTPEETKLLRDARAIGCKGISGAAMLVYQGAQSFEYWFPGKVPDIAVMKQALGMEGAR
jgi:shikimate dehydrogenase